MEENSPYGMIGEGVETSASFEARSAPLPYPRIIEPRNLINPEAHLVLIRVGRNESSIG